MQSVEDREPWSWDRARRWYRRVNDASESWAQRWTLPILAALCVLVTVASLPGGVAAMRNEGRPGVFTAVNEDCTGRAVSICLWEGSFVSDDGTIRVDDVSYDGPGIDAAGDQVRALAVGDDPSDVYAPGDTTILWLAPFGILSLAYLVWWSRRRWRNRRATPVEPIPEQNQTGS